MEIFEKHFKSTNMAKNAKKEASVKRKVIAKKKEAACIQSSQWEKKLKSLQFD